MPACYHRICSKELQTPDTFAYHSVATLLLAIADPQPKVLKQDSVILPCSSTCTRSRVSHSMRCAVYALLSRKISVSVHPQSYPDLQFHNVSTRRCSYQASTDAIVQLGKGPHISWLLIMVNHLHAQYTASCTIPKDSAQKLCRRWAGRH